MTYALREAQAALDAGDYPVGAALVVNGTLLATARNALLSEGRTDGTHSTGLSLYNA